jgi:hypothetical protein
MWYPLPTFRGIFDAIAHDWLAKLRNSKVGGQGGPAQPECCTIPLRAVP